MKKRIFVVGLLLLFTASTSVFSLGIGAAFGLNGIGDENTGGNIMLSAKLDQLPMVLGLSYNLDDPFSFGLYGDWQMVRQPLVNFVNIYAGPGFFFSYTDVSDDALQLGLRIPVALYIFPVDFLELFLEVAPAFSFVPEIDLGFQSALGFRFWFN
ncbi:hypothetical protein [Sediminispirochaeta smaragdinae]|jgi:hypothetical protein|uniref:Uncharacterized protein n=1 Tax=Sediminispirochaeta smaragdinae (strain DSM 11293 / JCM 15392 / SEBR 4228) TaxID=573413 RepID=E1R5N8_SEDSS|nr:hypothetical protein [Sediminispirochaeta smaragdinae]ADK80653.1 hypothetical protein Spirs_1526 [Sediminispirochaeta smaragdinae DSM 11293]